MFLRLLQIAQRAKAGPWPLRSFWRALYWTIAELPAYLEALLPSPPIVPWSALEPVPVQLGGSAECAWAHGVTANSTSRAVGMPPMMAHSAEGACGMLDHSAAS